jgi:plastocyanin
VAGGTLVESYLKEAAKADPEAEEPPPALEKLQKQLPMFFDEEVDASTGANPFVQAAARPCFYETGNPPTKAACDAAHRKQPDSFTGKQVFISSGYLEDQDQFTVKLDKDIEPGTYSLMCMVHLQEMVTKVTVVDDDAKIPSPADVTAAGQKDLNDLAAKLKPAADKVLNSTSSKAEAGPDTHGDEALSEIPIESVNVFPRAIAIAPGGRVTWTFNGFHVVAFNAPEDARPGWAFDSAGNLALNSKALLPQNSPNIPNPPPAKEGAGEDSPPPQLKVDGGRYDGVGFKNSGTYLGNGDAVLVYTLTFTKAGTYQYKCLIHPDMEGTVKVG